MAIKAQVLIDEKRARMLLAGKKVTVRIPPNATVLDIRLVAVAERNWTAEVFDTFFNGRPAR